MSDDRGEDEGLAARRAIDRSKMTRLGFAPVGTRPVTEPTVRFGNMSDTVVKMLALHAW